MARAHRLGQTNKVMIFRLVTRGTIEERMMQMTKKKMVLEHLVVGRMRTQVLNQEELDDILRYGAKELFSDDTDEAGKSRQIHYDDAAIDRLLDRSQVEAPEEITVDEEDNDFLKAFKVANFEYLEEDEAAAARLQEAEREAKADRESEILDSAARAKYWEDLLKDKYEQKQFDEFQELGKGKRSRRQANLHNLPPAEDDLAGMVDVSSEDEGSDQDANHAFSAVHDLPSSIRQATAKKSTPKKKARVEPLRPPPLMEGDGKSLKILGFSQKQRALFVKILMRFGLGDFSWKEFSPHFKKKTLEEIKEYGILFLTHIAEDLSDSQTFSDGVPKEGLRIQDVLVRLAVLHLMNDKVKRHVKDASVPLFSDSTNKRFSALRNTNVWKEEHDTKFLQAIVKHGYGRWQAIIDDNDYDLQLAICKELNLPAEPPVGCSTNQGAEPATTTEKDSDPAKDGSANGKLAGTDEQQNAKSNSDAVKNGVLNHNKQASDEDQGLPVETSEINSQKKMLEFARRRVALLERALNAEYHLESFVSLQQEGEADSPPANQDEAAYTDAVYRRQSTHDTGPSAIYPSPLTPEEITAAAFNDDPQRLDIAHLYNQMCSLLSQNHADAMQTYSGNKSAGIRFRRSLRELDLLCLEMRKALFGKSAQTSTLSEDGNEPNGPEGSDRGANASENADCLDGQNDQNDFSELDKTTADPGFPSENDGEHQNRHCSSSGPVNGIEDVI
ncbi:hypothetical protein O6H91_02G013700 [Diphasiastrum complanatum]|uniref:Uncharacterized protein n=2 Tax=Diphasiastrum complanatum TaxID=34168 RepID=A0ACC2ECZ8_DIPCM|nr:hypothetical protein O6H91_02G013700 [Diphasiastrum complanatum]KAJ7564342.1 hypothetical protein O6H91_02G013700 [Diphasiastrum complanatum]